MLVLYQTNHIRRVPGLDDKAKYPKCVGRIVVTGKWMD